MKVCGQKVVKFCGHTHTHAAQLVVRIVEIYKTFSSLQNSLEYETVLSSYFTGIHSGWAFYSLLNTTIPPPRNSEVGRGS